tara:strand:+ start:2104 stop:2325 length:222 start_codon:yes stop_codon:yes gene_type:complete
MKKYTTHTYEITYDELMEAVRGVILRNDPSANINLGTVQSQKWLEIDNNKGVPSDRKEIISSSTVFLSIEMEQ